MKTPSLPARSRADLVVTSPDGHPLLLVELKRHRIDAEDRKEIEAAADAVVPDFVMTVDPQQVVAAPVEAGTPEWEQAVRMASSVVLAPYSGSASLERIERFYLETLVEAWLRDFAQGWMSAQPPGYAELDRIGLASRLRGSEVHVEADA